MPQSKKPMSNPTTEPPLSRIMRRTEEMTRKELEFTPEEHRIMLDKHKPTSTETPPTSTWEERLAEFLENDVQVYGTPPKLDDDGWVAEIIYITKDLVPKLKSFIRTELQRERARGAKEAYQMFLKTIKETKAKFPGHKEFSLVVDLRDIKKTLKALEESTL